MIEIGLGCDDFLIAVYIGNRPSHESCSSLESISPLRSGEIKNIGDSCGNGWRKVFNVYAKFQFSLGTAIKTFDAGFSSWQEYRDRQLLQPGSQTALLFSPPNLNNQPTKHGSSLEAHPSAPTESKKNRNKEVKHVSIIHIICGKGYAKQLLDENQLKADFTWLDAEFAVDYQNNCFVCPYFDYRQLSNVKIERLIKLIVNSNK
jgi:hypothetical protein